MTEPGLVWDAFPNWTRTANGRNGELEGLFYCALNDSKRCTASSRISQVPTFNFPVGHNETPSTSSFYTRLAFPRRI